MHSEPPGIVPDKKVNNNFPNISLKKVLKKVLKVLSVISTFETDYLEGRLQNS